MTNNGNFDFSSLRYVPLSFFQRMTRGKIRPWDVLVVKDGATTGKVSLVKPAFPFVEAAINEHVFLCRPNPDVVHPQWLFYFLWSTEGQHSIRERFQGAAIGGINQSIASAVLVPLPPLRDQRRIAAILDEQMAAVEKARAALEAQLEAARKIPSAYVRESLRTGPNVRVPLREGISEITDGIGSSWSKFPVLGATRAGLAPAKDPVGKTPERYKYVDEGTIFYNPMRILLGSIALVDAGDKPGITSPDYVVFRCWDGVLHYRWFYHWLRSSQGDNFIRSLARGAVRERLLFRRLSTGTIEMAGWAAQLRAVDRIAQVRPVIAALERELLAMNTLAPALLRRAFNGEI